ncbi:MAG: winged helix-turn-helix domain-containing protein [Terriglobales bacterium]
MESAPEGASHPPTATVFRFGEFRLCLARRQLWRNSAPVPLTPRALDLLTALVRAPGQVISREALLKQVWGPVSVLDSNLTVNLCLLRRALACKQPLIATIPGRGYQFVAAVAESSAAEESYRETAAVWLAVSQFQRLGRAGRYPALGAALPKALVVALASLDGVHLRATSEAPNLELDWRLDGCYQETDGIVRVTAELVRAQDGGVAWAYRRDFAVVGSFQLHDLIAAWLKTVLSQRFAAL